MASSSINTCKITGFEIHTTNIRNPHKSASFISIHLAKTEFLHSKLPRPLELKTFPRLGQLQKHACWLMWLIFKKTPKSLCVCTKCALPIPNSVRFWKQFLQANCLPSYTEMPRSVCPTSCQLKIFIHSPVSLGKLENHWGNFHCLSELSMLRDCKCSDSNTSIPSLTIDNNRDSFILKITIVTIIVFKWSPEASSLN